MMIGHYFSSFGALLKTLRRRQHLTQQALAQALGMHRSTLIHWEQGDTLPESKTIVLELARLLSLGPQETRELLEASLTALAPHWSVPYPRNPYFTGREEVLEALHAQLGGEQAVALTQSSALHGLGGVGKTQIALEYAYRSALDYRAIFWIGAETEEQIVSSFSRVATALGLPEREEKEQQRVVAAVQRWLISHEQWLLIWDNVEDFNLLQRFLPATRSGAILLTTRRQALGTLAQGLDLTPMEQEEGMAFLLRRAKVFGPEVSREQLQHFAEQRPVQYAAAAELVTELGGLPLALDQAGAYLEEMRCGLSAYLELFRSHRAALLQQRGSEASDHPASVSTTFTLAIKAIVHRHPAVLDLLQVCALLQPDAIPEEFFRQGREYLGPALEAVSSDALEWDRVVGVACSYSLVSRQPEEQTLSLHRLVQAVLLDSMTNAEQEQWYRQVIEALDTVFLEVQPTNTEYARWKQCERLLPHALFFLNRRTDVPEKELTQASLAHKMAQYLRENGRYVEAELLFQRALLLREQTLGSDHLDVASSLGYLAILYKDQGKYTEAEPLYHRALHIRERILGPDHPQVARLLNNLGVLFWQQCRHAEAEPLYQRALRIWKQTLGPDHPDTTFALDNLAGLYGYQGRYAEAEPLHRQAARIREQTLGADHTQVARSLNNLAELFRVQGRYAEAEPLSQRALHIWEQALGLDHPDATFTFDTLASLYAHQGRYTEAELLHRRAVYIREQMLGADHPEAAFSLNNLAETFRMQDRYAEAEPLSRRALHIWEQALGPDHPEIALALDTLANLYAHQGRYAEAELLSQRAVRIREQALGVDHPRIVETLTNLGYLYQEQGQYAEAEACYLRILHIQEQQPDQQHPATAETLHSLAYLYQKQGKVSHTRSFAERALPIRSHALGDADPKALATRTLYAQLSPEQSDVQVKTASAWEAGKTCTPPGEEGHEESHAERDTRLSAAPLDCSPSQDNSLQVFLDARCEQHPHAWCRSADLWQAYLQWTEDRHERYPLSRGTFIAQLKAQGYCADRTKTARIWRGIALAQTGDDGR